MSADLDQWKANLIADHPAVDIRFRPGAGGVMSPEWAAYMLNLWWAAQGGKLTFAEAVKAAAVHFMIGEQP